MKSASDTDEKKHLRPVVVVRVAGVRLRTPARGPRDRGPQTDPSHPGLPPKAQVLFLICMRGARSRRSGGKPGRSPGPALATDGPGDREDHDGRDGGPRGAGSPWQTKAPQ